MAAPGRLLFRSGSILSGGGGVIGGGGYGDVFYVDAVSGSDSNDGKLPTSAWRTTDKVSSLSYVPGASILFKRGQTHVLNDTLRLRNFDGSSRRVSDLPVYVGAYGTTTDTLPKLSAWKVLNPASWVNTGGNVWRIDVNAAILSGSNIGGTKGANIGRLLVDGDIKTILRAYLADLANDWDFYCDRAQYMYVYSATNPGTRAAEIKASPNMDMIGYDPGIKVRDIWFEGTGANAGNVGSHTDIQWCVFYCIGGSMFQPPLLRYGNGLQNFGGCQNLTARNNFFFENYDVALTCQGYPMNTAAVGATPASGWDNIDFSDNWIARCAQGIEFWNSYGNGRGLGTCPAGTGFRSVQARRLHLFDIGRGASRLGRMDYLVWVCFIEEFIETPYYAIPISITEMHNCSDRILFGPTVGDTPRAYSDFVLEASNLSLPTNSLIAKGSTRRVEEWATYVAETGIGVGSTMTIEAAGAALTSFETIYAAWQASRV